jgi:hypothetical protein
MTRISLQKSNCAHQMMINVNITEQKDENWKLTWQLQVGDTPAAPQESLYSTYEEASEKALQLLAAASPNQSRLTDFVGGL